MGVMRLPLKKHSSFLFAERKQQLAGSQQAWRTQRQATAVLLLERNALLPAAVAARRPITRRGRTSCTRAHLSTHWGKRQQKPAGGWSPARHCSCRRCCRTAALAHSCASHLSSRQRWRRECLRAQAKACLVRQLLQQAPPIDLPGSGSARLAAIPCRDPQPTSERAAV